MILSHKHKLIFMKPRKVAGTSFEIALSQFCGPQDILTPISTKDEKNRTLRGGPGAQNFHKPLGRVFSTGSFEDIRHGRWPREYYNHMTAREVRDAIGQEIWDSYFKISIVRNPWDSAVSRFYWRPNRQPLPESDFESWCVQSEDFQNNHPIYMLEEKSSIDFFLRFENFEADTRELERQRPELSGLWSSFSSIHAKGGIRPQKATAANLFAKAPAADAVIREACRFEIETFNYQLDLPSSDPDR